MTLQECLHVLNMHVISHIDHPRGKWWDIGLVLDVTVGGYHYRYHPRALWSISRDDKCAAEDHIEDITVNALKYAITEQMDSINLILNAPVDDDILMNLEYP